MTSFERALELAREDPVSPSPSRREEVRAAVLSAARFVLSQPKPSRRRRNYGVAIAVVAAAAVLLFVVSSPAPSHRHASVTASRDARYRVVSSAPDEIVRLEAGTIEVEVTKLHGGERFRVIVGDGEVEVRGTAFAVSADADRLVHVDVHHGRVEVHPRDREMRVLGAGDSWNVVPVRVAAEPPPPPGVVAPAVVDVPRPPPTPRPRVTKPVPIAPPPPAIAKRSGDELAYDDAWAAMRASRYGDAAQAFARVIVLAPDGGLVEDATFWQAVALARAQRPHAVTAFRDFLDGYPKSPHAGEANAMLGWLLVETGERAEAQRRFRAAASDPSKTVRESARSGLDATR